MARLLPRPIQKLFEGEFSVDIVRLILNQLPLKQVQVACSVNKYMNQKVCDDSFWLLYYENMFLGPKPRFKSEKELNNWFSSKQEQIRDLYFYLFTKERVEYAAIIYKKYKKYMQKYPENYFIKWATIYSNMKVVKSLVANNIIK